MKKNPKMWIGCVSKGKPFEDVNFYNAVFLDKETRERYCAWKTEQEAKK